MKIFKHKLVPQVHMFLRRITFMLSNPRFIIKAHQTWVSVCYNIFLLMYMLCWIRGYIVICASLVSMKIDILLDIFDEPFFSFYPVGDFVVAKRVYKGCPTNRVTFVHLKELYMLDFDVILGMD